MTLGKKGAIRWLHSVLYCSKSTIDQLHAAAALDAMRGLRIASHETMTWLGERYEQAHWYDKLALDVVIRCVLEVRRV